MNLTDKFRADLERLMPGYKWVVHRSSVAYPIVRFATGTQSSGSNRLSTLEVKRIEHYPAGNVTYTVRSAGYGRRAPWLHTNSDTTLARALRGLQDHYNNMAQRYLVHANDLRRGRRSNARL